MWKLLLLMPLAGLDVAKSTGPVPEWQQESADTCIYHYHTFLKKNVYLNVDTNPEFPGGAVAYMRFINRNLKVPAEAIENGQYIPSAAFEFVVDDDGRCFDPHVNNKTDTLLMDAYEKEILRLVKIMPQWQPGKCNGKPVAVKVKRPLIICLTGE